MIIGTSQADCPVLIIGDGVVNFKLVSPRMGKLMGLHTGYKTASCCCQQNDFHQATLEPEETRELRKLSPRFKKNAHNSDTITLVPNSGCNGDKRLGQVPICFGLRDGTPIDMMVLVKSHCYKLRLVSYHQLIHPISLCVCSSKISIKLVVLAVSLRAKSKLVFSSLTLYQSISQLNVKKVCIKDTSFGNIASNSNNISTMEAAVFTSPVIYATRLSKGSHNLQVCSAEREDCTLF
ncbi:hypothetical protein A6R68_01471, partial [Neotoma lepida]